VPKLHDDGGSAALEFLALGVPGVLIVIMAMQIVYGAYLSTIAFDAASEGAAVAALADSSDLEAQNRAAEVVAAVSGAKLEHVQIEHTRFGPTSTSAVTVRLSSEILGFGSYQVSQTVEALDEPQN